MRPCDPSLDGVRRPFMQPRFNLDGVSSCLPSRNRRVTSELYAKRSALESVPQTVTSVLRTHHVIGVQDLIFGDENSKLRADFIDEMRTLSKLRHPCITTVMGAVVSCFSKPSPSHVE